LIKIENHELIIIEQHKKQNFLHGYVYYPISDKLVHISRLFEGKEIGRASRYVKYEYRIPLYNIMQKFGKQVTFYEFSFSNNQYLYIEKYIIDCKSKTVQTLSVNDDELLNLKFEIIHSEKSAIEEYKKFTPKIVNKIKKIKEDRNIKFLFRRHPKRMMNVYNNPDYGLNVAMIYPSERSRKLALRTYIRNIYKLYVLMLISKELDGKTKKFFDDNESYWTIHFYSDKPTAIIEIECNKIYTIWFQFTVKSWLDIINEACMAEKTLNVRQDIAIFEGEYKNRNKLEKNPPQKSIFITIKTKITKNDIKQLENYAKLFGNVKNSTLILVCLEKIKYKDLIEDIGWIVIEGVFPEKEGEKKFMDLIKNLTK
jgi:hypothetical protein